MMLWFPPISPNDISVTTINQRTILEYNKIDFTIQDAKLRSLYQENDPYIKSINASLFNKSLQFTLSTDKTLMNNDGTTISNVSEWESLLRSVIETEKGSVLKDDMLKKIKDILIEFSFASNVPVLKIKFEQQAMLDVLTITNIPNDVYIKIPYFDKFKRIVFIDFKQDTLNIRIQKSTKRDFEYSNETTKVLHKK